MFKKSNVINHWFLHSSYDLFFRLLYFKQLALNFWLSSKYFPPTAAEAEAVVLWREMQCNARQTTFGLLNCFIMSGFCCYWAYWLIWENCKKWVEKIYERKESREIWLHSPHQTKWRDSPQIPQILGNLNDLWESIYFTNSLASHLLLATIPRNDEGNTEQMRDNHIDIGVTQ